MKSSGNFKKAMFYLAGVGIFLLTYYGLFKGLSAENDRLNEQVAQLQGEAAVARQIAGHEEEYKTKMNEMNGKMDEMLGVLPAGIKEEDCIMLGSDLQKNTTMEIASVGISAPNLMYTVNEEGMATVAGQQTADSEEGEEQRVTLTEGNKYLFNTKANFVCTTTYKGMKQAIDRVLEKENKMSIDMVTLSYDSATGYLLGSMVIDLYHLAGVDKEYEQPDVPVMSTGKENIFNSLEIGDGNGTGN
ncbi:MAG: hypothetical protein RR364_04415 [Lachnospiraceae bacterium]